MTSTPTNSGVQLVRLADICKRPDVFQFRHIEADDRHVRQLTNALKQGEPLDPMTLWRDPEGTTLVVVDGHHRLEAYRRSNWSQGIPAFVHTCCVDDARLLALNENGKTRLALTSEERMDAAWSLVALDRPSYSKRIIVQATGVSDGTVAKMRRTRKELCERAPDEVLPERWWQALAAMRDDEQREFTDEDRQAMIDAKAATLDAQIGKQLGFMAGNQIEAACIVVADRLGRQGLRILLGEYGAELGLEVDLDPLF